jgi:hypothetical protein
MHKAAREVEEFREFQQLTCEFLGTNAEICRLRPVEQAQEAELKKTVEAIRQEIKREVGSGSSGLETLLLCLDWAGCDRRETPARGRQGSLCSR